MDMTSTSKSYIVAEVWGTSGSRYVHPTLRTLPEAIEKLRTLVEANRAINPRAACTFIEIFELKGRYPVQLPPILDEANPGLPQTEDVLDPSKSVVFPNV